MPKLWNNIGRLVALDLVIQGKSEWPISTKKKLNIFTFRCRGGKRKIKLKKMHKDYKGIKDHIWNLEISSLMAA